MVAVLEKKIHARRIQRLEKLVHEAWTNGRLNNRKGTGKKGSTFGMCRQEAYAADRLIERALAAMIQSGEIVDLPGPVDAHRYACVCFGEEIEEVVAKQSSVGLDAYRVALWRQANAETMQQRRQIFET